MMKVYLYLNDKLLNFTLPQDISGSFSFDEFDDEDSKLINIEARDNKWFLYSTDDVKVINNSNIVKDIMINSNSFYYLNRDGKNYIIYVCGLFDNNFSLYKFNNLNLLIGNNNKCNIRYNIGNSDYVCQITFNNNFIISTYNVPIYVNSKIINKQTILKYGDIIDIYSLRIILLNGMILINNPNNDSNLVLSNSGLNKLETPNIDCDNSEIKDQNLYSKDDYFSKSPRIRRIIEEKVFKLSTPPRSGKEEELPLLLTIGPMLTMAIISFVTLGSNISKILSHEAKFSQQIPSLVSAGAMLLSMLMWPLIMKHYNKKHKEKKRRELIEKYNKYLDTKRLELDLEYKLQKEIWIENLITSEECLNILSKKGYNFWDKRVDQEDFLLVRIGIGDVLLKAKIEYPEEGFTIEEDELRKQADKLVEEYKYIKNVPMGYSFLENRITAIMGNINKGYSFINNIILQLITFYSYEDLKIVIFTNDINSNNWQYIKYLNHNFNNERDFRFFGSNLENIKYVSDYLNNEVNFRMNNKMEFPKPHYLIITDDYEKIKSYDFIKNITETDENLGFSCLILENKLSKLPSKCSNFISLGVDNRGGILKNSYQRQEQSYFMDEVNNSIDMMQVSKMIANIPIEFEGGLSHLPDSISFMEMEKVGKVEQLNILNRWNMNDSTTSLKAEVGVDDQGNLMYLDLHEKAHGPHGLIAGTTGSGKSEFIITYILAMSINFSPDDVSFILIDYKGGGLALAFENKVTGVSLPHLAGTITNLDKAEMDRTLVSIDSEVKRRQHMFNIARDNLGESTIDIYKYQRFYHEGRVSDAIPHLFIICDEFAELKSQQPDFMDNLISVARIGRSLGVHLILATQKPTGVVNDQIWSNSRFKVCLKVQDEADSREMIKKNDAAYLKQVGRYYLQVGYDEYFALGQSGWCGAKYYPSDKIVKQVDKSINIIDESGLFLKSIKAASGNKVKAEGEQLGAILKSIIEVSNRVGKKSKRLWLENISDTILVDNLVKKYNLTFDKSIYAIVGEYDAPERQEQGLITLDFLKSGNTIIYGNDGSEREMLLNTIVYSTTNYYGSDKVNFYAIDYGSEILNKYVNLNHFGGVVINGEDEEFNNLFRLIRKEIKKRKKILADFGGEYKYYNKGNLPLMIIIFNNYDSIYESNQNLYDDLPELVRDSERYGIVYIFTVNSVNSIHSKVSSSCSNMYSFKLKDSSDYGSALGVSTKVTPRDIFGRGLLYNDGVHEFQTAKIVLDDSSVNSFIQNYVVNKNKVNPVLALKIPLLPDIVTFNDIVSGISNIHSVPIGISKKDLEIITYDFTLNIGNFIASNRLSNIDKFMKSLLYVFRNIKDINLFIIDPMKLLNLNINYFSNYYTSNFDDVVDKMIEGIQKLFENKQNMEGIIVIYGLNKFVNSIKKNKLEDLSKIIKSYEKFSLIMVDDASKIKSFMFDSWLSSISSTNDGIWIGKGITDQNLFHLTTINKSMTQELRNNMGYIINEGSVDMIKLIDFISNGDENGE